MRNMRLNANWMIKRYQQLEYEINTSSRDRQEEEARVRKDTGVTLLQPSTGYKKNKRSPFKSYLLF